MILGEPVRGGEAAYNQSSLTMRVNNQQNLSETISRAF
jgi:hypothetical protein